VSYCFTSGIYEPSKYSKTKSSWHNHRIALPESVRQYIRILNDYNCDGITVILITYFNLDHFYVLRSNFLRLLDYLSFLPYFFVPISSLFELGYQILNLVSLVKLPMSKG